MANRSRAPRSFWVSLPEVASLAWMLLATLVLLGSTHDWISKSVDPLSFLGRAVGVLAGGAALITLYFIVLQRMEALLWRDWRYFTWGQALLAYFLLIELVDAVFVLPEYVHLMELLTILVSVGICSWYLTSLMSRLASIVAPKRSAPRVSPRLILMAWLAVLIPVTAWSLPKLSPLPRPRYGDLALDVAIIALLVANLWRLEGVSEAPTEAGRWLMEASLSAIALGAVAEGYVLLEDLLDTPKVINVFGYTLTGAVALALALSGFGYYLLGTTTYRAPSEREELEPEVDWGEFGLSIGEEGEVVVVEVEPLISPPEAIVSLASWLRGLGMKVVAMGRRGTPLREVALGSGLAIQISPGRMAAPREVAPGEFEVGLSPSVILGIVGRVTSEGGRVALVLENVSDVVALMGLDGAYRLIRSLIDALIPGGGVVALVVNQSAHGEREMNLLRGLATWIIDLTTYPPDIRRVS